MLQPRRAKLVFQDGKTVTGYSFGYESSSAGEVVFNTGLVGYVKVNVKKKQTKTKTKTNRRRMK
jgi:hypothetical protein